MLPPMLLCRARIELKFIKGLREFERVFLGGRVWFLMTGRPHTRSTPRLNTPRAGLGFESLNLSWSRVYTGLPDCLCARAGGGFGGLVGVAGVVGHLVVPGPNIHLQLAVFHDEGMGEQLFVLGSFLVVLGETVADE